MITLSLRIFAVIIMAVSVPLKADENLLGYTVGAETVPQKAQAVYMWNTYRAHKNDGRYQALDTRLEYEYGLTHSLTASLITNFLSTEINDANPLSNDSNKILKFQSVAGLLKYNIWSPFTEIVGISIAAEPSFEVFHKVTGQQQQAYFLDTNLIFQKNFLDDTLITLLNLSPKFGMRDERNGTGYESEFSYEITTGTSWRFTRNWYIGAEARYESFFDEYSEPIESAFFLGPSLHWGGRKGWVTLTWLPQIFGNGKGNDRNLQLSRHEKQEIRFKIGMNL